MVLPEEITFHLHKKREHLIVPQMNRLSVEIEFSKIIPNRIESVLIGSFKFPSKLQLTFPKEKLTSTVLRNHCANYVRKFSEKKYFKGF